MREKLALKNISNFTTRCVDSRSGTTCLLEITLRTMNDWAVAALVFAQTRQLEYGIIFRLRNNVLRLREDSEKRVVKSYH